MRGRTGGYHQGIHLITCSWGGPGSQTVYINGLPFNLDDSSVSHSGVGAFGGFQAGYRLPITQRLDLVATIGSQAKRYRDAIFADTLVNASVGPKWKFEGGYLGLYATADHRWMADADQASSFGGLFSGGYSPDAANLFSADTGCSQRRYSTDWRGGDLSYQDGYNCFLAGRYDHYVNSTTYLRILGNANMERTKRAHLDSDGGGAGIGFYHEFAWGLSLYLQGMVTRTGFNGDFPGFDWTRQDKRYDASVNLTKRDFQIFGLAPMLQYTYTHNDSNIPLTAYDEYGLALTMTKRF